MRLISIGGDDGAYPAVLTYDPVGARECLAACSRSVCWFQRQQFGLVRYRQIVQSAFCSMTRVLSARSAPAALRPHRTVSSGLCSSSKREYDCTVVTLGTNINEISTAWIYHMCIVCVK